MRSFTKIAISKLLCSFFPNTPPKRAPISSVPFIKVVLGIHSNTMKMTFHHIGLPTDEPQPGETYVEDTKVWVTRPEDHPYRVEYLRFEADSPVTGPVRDMAHVGYRIDGDIHEALKGEDVVIEPFTPMEGLQVAFFMKDGAVVEYMQFREGATEFSDLDD